MFTVTAYRCGELAQREHAPDRPTADAILGRLVRGLPDCEVTLEQDGIVLISMAPTHRHQPARLDDRAPTGEPT